MNWLHALLVAEVRTGLRENGWTQKQLAQRAGITEKHLSQMLLGKADGSLDVWGNLLLAVGRVQRFGHDCGRQDPHPIERRPRDVLDRRGPA